ncbi:hypothetical protein ACFSTH_19275 [Paenibacillus yanchengensis]|uniref:Transposase n=1 Tax=Paenibacillus yanchengensis TaxID=2035833 RepID=A0ABW4YMJ2_9BACL
MLRFEKALDNLKREGIQEGKQEGRHAERLEIAMRMLNLEMDVVLIAATTGFTMEEVEQLKVELLNSKDI